MKKIIYIFLIFAFTTKAQDKLYFKNGTLKNCFLISVAKDVVYYKNYDTSATTIETNKNQLVMLQTYNGIRYVFANDDKKNKVIALDSIKLKRNNFGIQPFNFLLGRFTFNYERLTKNNKIGFMIPLSITFNPFESIYKNAVDTTTNSYKRNHRTGTNIISGFDVNFYLGKKQNSKYFIGPRFRYGTDLFIANLEGYSLQTQFGLKFSNPTRKFESHLSLGFGFLRIVSLPYANRINPKQSYVWYSLNYRIGIKW